MLSTIKVKKKKRRRMGGRFHPESEARMPHSAVSGRRAQWAALGLRKH